MDVIGKKFGRLTVIANAPRKYYVVCKCDCGSICQVKVYNLTKAKNPTSSCGCLRRETSSVNGKNHIRQNSEKRLEMMAKYGTNLGIISSQVPFRNNKSGCTGVWYDPVHGTYQAYISLRQKKYRLGTFHNLNEAITAREKAQERLFAPILAQIRAE